MKCVKCVGGGEGVQTVHHRPRVIQSAGAGADGDEGAGGAKGGGGNDAIHSPTSTAQSALVHHAVAGMRERKTDGGVAARDDGEDGLGAGLPDGSSACSEGDEETGGADGATGSVGEIVEGAQVVVVGGKTHVGARGVVKKVHGGTYVTVILHGAVEARKAKTSLRVLAEGEGVEGVIDSGPMGTGFGGGDMSVNPRRAKRVVTKKKEFAEEPAPEGWKAADSDKGQTMFGTKTVVKQRFGKAVQVRTLLSDFFESRLSLYEEPLQEALDEPIDRCLYIGEKKYELAFIDVAADGDKSGGEFNRKLVARYLFVLVEAPGLATISVKEELENIGGFERLTPRKAAARMKLLLSEVATYRDGRRAIHYPKETEVTVSENMSLNGGGFIGAHLASKYIAPGTKGAVDGERNVGLQMRIASKDGIFKAMLAVKLIPEGEPQIQLNKSMLKVGPSRRSKSSTFACMTVTSRGLYPSAPAVIMGQLNDPSSPISLGKKKVPKSFSPKPLKAMITRLWTSMGVPSDVCEKYVKESRKPEGMEHYWNVGLNDPTGYLEPDTVFVTGLKKQRASLDRVFVTRSPCTQRKDGRVLKAVSVKPQAMPEKMWNWINDLSFGAILFGTPKEGYRSMTENIADGDLDGDPYLCCWAQSILQYLPLDGIESEPLEVEELATSPGDREYNENWLTEMLDHISKSLHEYKDIQQLKGQLYNLAAKRDFDDPAADKFAAASKKTIDYQKHGKPITLRADLIEKVDARLRKYLVAPCDI